jgi:hypothetical protein
MVRAGTEGVELALYFRLQPDRALRQMRQG